MLIELKNVGKRLGDFHLIDISMELPEGYVMGLVGPNGAGKTSLLHLILGLYKPDHGEILINGMNYEENEREIHEIIGTVLVEELFDIALTLRQNGELYGKYYRDYDGEVLENYLQRFALNGNRKYKALSKGEKLKFQLAFALSHNAKLLILDEPTANFDPDFRKEFFGIMKEFIANGERSILLATHLTEDLERRADYITYLEKGESVFAGDIETLHESYRLICGEEYKINLLPSEAIICKEKGSYTTRALIRHRQRYSYDVSLTVTVPTIEELIYFMTKRGTCKK